MSFYQPGMPSSAPTGGDNFGWINERFARIDAQIRELGPSVADSFRPVVADLAAKQATLEAQQATLTTQQADLEAAQATLTAQQSALEVLIASQVVPAAFSGTGSNFATAASTFVNVATATLTVPSDVTRAVVLANGYVAITDSRPSTDLIEVRTVIAGSAGDPSQLVISSGQRLSQTADAVHTLTGLTAGGTFTVAVQVWTPLAWSATSTNAARASGVVLWLR